MFIALKPAYGCLHPLSPGPMSYPKISITSQAVSLHSMTQKFIRKLESLHTYSAIVLTFDVRTPDKGEKKLDAKQMMHTDALKSSWFRLPTVVRCARQ